MRRGSEPAIQPSSQPVAIGTPSAGQPEVRTRLLPSGNPLGGRHLPALDGLRGLALLIVVVHHTNYSFPAYTVMPVGLVRSALTFVVVNGWCGVDLFFVLSGFLITTILLKSREATNYYGAFYMRRLLRLAPMYYLLLVIVFFLPWPNSVTPSHAPFSTQIWWWLNASNIPIALHGTTLPLVSMCWSLAVEEQFYLVWPVLARWVRERTLLTIALVGAAAVPVLRVLPPVLHYGKTHPLAMYVLTPLHCEGLLLGAAVAMSIQRGLLTERAVPLLRVCAVVSAAASAVLLQKKFAFYSTPMVSVCGAAVVALLTLRRDQGPLAAVLRWKPLRLLGVYSYAMYLTHAMILQWLQAVLLRTWAPPPGWTRLLWCYGTPVVLSFALGALLWWAYDGRINGLKRFFPYRFAPANSGGA